MVPHNKTLRDIIKEEYVKCAANPVYFMKKYAKIQHPVRGKILFELWNFQEDVLRDFQDHRYNICLKSRQLGISTLIAGYSLWLMLFQTDQNILVIATKQETAKNLVTKVRVMYDNLPSWLKTAVVEDNKLSLRFKNGSQIKAVSAAADAARSEALSLLIIDEAAFIDNIEEIWASAQSTINTGGSAIINSCVVGDTLIFSNDGIKEIKDFSPSETDGGFVVDEYSIVGKDKLRNGNLFKNNGYQPTKKIITKFSEVEGTHIHKLWAYKDGNCDWFELKDLSVGDRVAIQYGMDVWGNFTDISDCPYTDSNKYKNRYMFKSITNDLAYLFGLYLSEGSTYKRKNTSGEIISFNLTLTCGDDISGVFDRLGMNYSCHDGLHYTVSSMNLMELFEYVGFDLSLKAHEKFIPSKLMKMPREQMIHLLRGMYDGDGCARKDRKGISITSSSEKMVNQIQSILINLGILSIKTEKTIEQLNKNAHFEYPFKHNSYVLTCSDKQAINFRDTVSFNLERKRQICESYDEVNRTSTYDYIEDGISFIKEVFEKTKLTAAEFNRKTGIQFNGVLNKKRDYKTTRICRKNCIIVYSMFSHLMEPDSKWHRIIADNLIWVDIKEIKDGFDQTYDFSLPNNDNDFWAHSVLYNGILGHQTPNGVGNFYHKQWVNAKTARSAFNPIFLHWTVHPERDQAWRDQQDVILGPALAAQECFTGNVRVITKTGWVPIKDIQVGDEVLSHTGKFQRVIRKYVDDKNNLYQVKSSRNHKQDCYVTSNHPIAVKNGDNIDYIEVKDYNKKMGGILSPEMNLTDSTVSLDLYDIIKPKYFKKVLCDDGNSFFINDRKHKVVHNRYLNVGYDLGYFVGLYLAEGSGCRLRKTFSFNALTEQNSWPTDVQKICFDLFGIQNTQIRVLNQSNGQLSVASEIIAGIIDKFVDGNRAWKKRLSKFAYSVGNKEFWRGILDGIFVGDGCNTTTANHAISITSSELIYDAIYASYVTNIFGISSTINESTETKIQKLGFRDKNSELHSKSTLRFLNTKHTDTLKITENTEKSDDASITWNFESIDPSITKTVYNLEVENDNTYVTEFGLVHNCDGDFLSSGKSVVDGNIIDWYQKTYVTEPKEKRGAENGLWIWDYPDPSKSYMICADVARGDGKDFSAFHIIDIENVEQVAEYQGQLDTKSYGNLLVSLATEYNDALLVVENANIGWATIQQIIDRNYPNLYYTYKEEGYTDPSVHIPKGYDIKDKSQMVPGFTNSSKTRPLIVSKYEMYFRERVPIIKSNRLAEEMFVFIWHGGRAEAQTGYNDDLVMSFAIGLWVRDTALKLRQDGLLRTKLALDYMQKSTQVFNTANMRDNKKDTGWTQEIGGKQEDLTWLI